MNILLKNLLLSIITIFLLIACTNQDVTNEKSESQSKAKTEEPVSSKKMNEAYDKAMKIVDQMPLFAGCEDWDCSNMQLIQYIQENLKYPKEAKEAKIEGKVFVQFIVETDGSVSNIHIAKDIGAGLGNAAAELVAGMNDLTVKWTPGKNEGKDVPVVLTLPVSYIL